MTKYISTANDMCTCGHIRADHATTLKGVSGMCFHEKIKGWSYCECQKFTKVDEGVKQEVKP